MITRRLFTFLLPIFLSIASYAIEDSPPFYFPPHCHRLVAVSILGDTLDLEDGSEWAISPSDSEKVFHWKALDPLVIKRNTSWFSHYKYQIFNKKMNETIQVNLYMLPAFGGDNTNYIYDIDYPKGEIILQDKSRWKVKDRKIFEKWSYDHLIIIGYEEGNFWSPSMYLLINASINDTCQASRS